MKVNWGFFCLAIVGFLSSAPFTMATVVINEVFYDPIGSDTGFEFVEILNIGVSSFELTGYELKLADSSYYTFNTFVLPAGQRVVVHNNLAGDDTATNLFTGPLSNMSNTQGSIALFSGPHATDNIIDFVQYGAGSQQWQSAAVSAGIWTTDDFVMDAPEGLSINLDPDGQDTNLADDWAICDPSALAINCEPAVPTATPITPTITPAPPTSTPGPPTNTPDTPPPTNTPSPTPSSTTAPTSTPTNTPTATPTLTPATPSSPTASPTAEPTQTPVSASVIINEIFYDPSGTDTGFEWIELINISPVPLQLQSWILKPSNADYFVFPDFILESGFRVLVHINAEGTATGSELFAGLSQNMGNTSGSVVLFTGTPYSVETIVDFVQYGDDGQTWESLAVSAGIWTTGDYTLDVDEGYSLNRYPDAQDHNISADWMQCLTTFLDQNCIPPTPSPSPSASPSPTAGTQTPTASPETPTQTHTPTTTPTTEPTSSGIAINEVFYNPSGNDTGFEFVEIINNSESAIELTGFDLKPDTSSYYTFPVFILAAGHRVVIRINTVGENTGDELFTGLTGNMGNTSGFVALFNSTTHGSSTIIDYVEFGAGGQTWESTAVNAGIWTTGDFVAVVDEGLSMNLDPDGFDNNLSTDWAPCEPSLNSINCQSVPTATPTPTAPTGTPTAPTGTPTATAEPTSTPPAREGVVINEVLFDPDGTDTGLEYIELFNNSSDPITLTGYDLKPGTSSYFTFPDFVLQPDSYVVIHINTSGTNSDTDLYTGATSNMGNSTGFIALFDDVSHSASTLIDYIAYGAGGQTWESAAVEAGIWTAGDFIPVSPAEGLSLNLCPNGDDHDSASDWQFDTLSAGQTNTCSEPTATPTTTPTITPTRTPTRTPTPRPTVEPVIQLAGFGATSYRLQTGGTVQILAWVTDPENDVSSVKVLLGGEVIAELYDDGNHADMEPGDNFYGISFELPASGNSGSGTGLLRLQLRIIATDSRGFDSHTWPLFTVDPGAGYSTAPDSPAWESLESGINGGSSSAGDQPLIYVAGFMDTRVSAAGGGQFTLLAVTTGTEPVSEVELYYQGLPTGVMLFDNGEHNDFSAGDGVFGLSFSIGADAIQAGDYPFQLRARDINGRQSDLWPYLTISE